MRSRWVSSLARESQCLRPHHVSSPRHLERSVRISRTTLTCLFRAKGYGTYSTGATVPDARHSRKPLNGPSVSCSHGLHRFQPKPLRCRARLRADQPSPWRISSVSGLANQRASLSLRPCLPYCQKNHRTAGPLRSTGVTPLHRYLGPVRLPLAFGHFPGSPRLYGLPCSAGFPNGTRRASPVAQHVLVTMPSITTPPECTTARSHPAVVHAVFAVTVVGSTSGD